MKQILSDFHLGYKIYDKHVALLLPLLLLTSILIIIDRIPYLNLFKENIAITILIIDWFALLWLSKIRPFAMLKIGFLLFLVTYVLYIVKLSWLAEVIANLCYVIFSTAVVFEIIHQVKNG